MGELGSWAGLWGEPGAATLLLGAFVLDLLLGEMPNRIHPVVYMGRVTRLVRDRGMRLGPRAQLVLGAVAALGIPAAFAAAAWVLLRWAAAAPLAQVVLALFVLKSTFAVRALGAAAARMGEALGRHDLDRGRYELRSLCSRDSQSLGEEELASATVASVAENLSDSFIAPVFFYLVAGIPGAVFYRATNTMDAIIGYRGRYEYLGKAAARLDDLLNLIPARLTALLLLAAGALCRQRVKGGLAALRRDRRKTASPNGGWPMATMAGLLGIEIIKVDHYRLGDPLRRPSAASIAASWQVALVAALVGLALALFWLERTKGTHGW